MLSADPLSPLFGSPFSALLRRYREAAGMTQEELAGRAGLSVRGISDLERGLRQAPRRETVDLLGDALALPPHQRALLEAAARPAMQRPRWQETPPPNNLPTHLTPLLGRERELRAAADLLARADARLLTLTGPAGVGKTRLALAVATDLLDRFEDGVYLLSLAALREPDALLTALAETLDLRLRAGAPLAEVTAALRDRRLLLVFDNFEHLLPAAPQVAALLEACPRMKALTTSREPLKLSGEREYAVMPLTGAPAAQLFIERAHAAQPAFAATEADLPAIEAICAQVDGLPLAIELAASWARVLPLPALLERLDHRLDLLRSGRRDAPERQRALRDAIAWSVDLLDPGERRLFRRLAVFVGGCSLDAAEAICADDAQERATVLDGLARLVEKNLLRAEMTPEGVRFGMLETLREFALEEFDANDEAEALARRHAQYYAQTLAQLGWMGENQDACDRQMEREIPNARTALAWTLERRESRLGLQLATPLGRWWYSRGAFDEAERWLRALLALDARGGPKSAPPQLRGAALFALILVALDRRHYHDAETLAREGLALAREHDEPGQMGNMLAELGHIAEARGNLAEARAMFEEALAVQTAHPEGAALGRTLSSLGNIARAQGDYTQARVYLDQSLAWVRERAFSFAVASGLVSLGHLDCEEGDFSGALARYGESLRLYQTLGNPTSLAWLLEGVAVALHAEGQRETVARVCGAIAALRKRAGAADQREWPLYVRASEATHAEMGDERFGAEFEAGCSLTLEQAVAFGLSLTASREPERT